MAKAPTIAALREEIERLTRVRDAGLLHPAGRARLKRLQNRLAQEKLRLPMAIKATREKLAQLESAYYG